MTELNFFTATKAHQAWKKRLYDCICGASHEPLNPDVIQLDNRCDLGKWLHAVRARDPKLSVQTAQLFARLLADHARFHLAAAEVARKAQSGQIEEALRMMQGGEYSQVSQRVIAELGELYLKRREFGMD